MGDSIKELYDVLDEDRPERIRSGIAVWTFLNVSSFTNKIQCENPATNDTRTLALATDGYPEEIAGKQVISDSGSVNPEIEDFPVRVVIPNQGGFREAWVHKWASDLSDLEEKPYSEYGREEEIEWEGSEQSADSERVRKRNGVFSEDDRRGSKNDLLK
ncbi:hypothetical protein [Halobacterium salinarum]|uniref:Uncharacterized protein n=1 Tax=Halobacterium salinarum (strain ATCC 33171 / DSM 3754 / JCM 8978 / NBRC 102687 / NCIMB 764 / 91-R6) TaxID=2597657 RepID=A0A4D6GWJ8_HALS9|nr:hypothetical protein [Halobacterium salinarum]QCC46149.1 uncharacterized protein HBSAL_13185 [Halobacterium salinarum]TYO73816.1 hypothetical protein APQ99_02354 [Halobacterium salinarum DSM 3754]